MKFLKDIYFFFFFKQETRSSIHGGVAKSQAPSLNRVKIIYEDELFFNNLILLNIYETNVILNIFINLSTFKHVKRRALKLT